MRKTGRPKLVTSVWPIESIKERNIYSRGVSDSASGAVTLLYLNGQPGNALCFVLFVYYFGCLVERIVLT